MADILTKEQRHHNMSSIKSRNTSPEVFIRKGLFLRGFRYHNNTNEIVGHPDIYVLKYHVAVFIHGCFWHRHVGCKYAYLPKTRTEFWCNKFATNTKRDQYVIEQLKLNHTRYIIIWECVIRRMRNDHEYANAVFECVTDFIKTSNSPQLIIQ